jgi:hypothetical protein
MRVTCDPAVMAGGLEGGAKVDMLRAAIEWRKREIRRLENEIRIIEEIIARSATDPHSPWQGV